MQAANVVDPTAIQMEEARQAFQEYARILGSTDADASLKEKTRREISFLDKEEVIQHILALWPDLITKRHQFNRFVRNLLLVGAFFWLLRFIFFVIKHDSRWQAYKAWSFQIEVVLLALSALPAFTLLGVFIIHGKQGASLHGIEILLPEYRDVRLLGVYLDALNFPLFNQGEQRQALVSALGSVLPLYASADVEAFSDAQRKTLLRELKTIAARIRKEGAFVAQEDADLLVAMVSALEADAARTMTLSGLTTNKMLPVIEGTLTRLEQDSEKALATADTGDIASRRRVHDATENAVLRLRSLREES